MFKMSPGMRQQKNIPRGKSFPCVCIFFCVYVIPSNRNFNFIVYWMYDQMSGKKVRNRVVPAHKRFYEKTYNKNKGLQGET